MNPEEMISEACPRRKEGLITIQVKDCEWCSTALAAIEKAVAQERERCVKLAEEEPELPGPVPDEILNLQVSLETQMRAAVQVTKRNIVARIRGT
jgi:hypothetical protein